MGFPFSGQSGTTFDDYVGYLGFFDSNDDEIRIDRWDNLTQANSAATPTTWPTGERLTVELDYRESVSDTITMTVFDSTGSQVASVSLADTAYDTGDVGWYNF